MTNLFEAGGTLLTWKGFATTPSFATLVVLSGLDLTGPVDGFVRFGETRGFDVLSSDFFVLSTVVVLGAWLGCDGAELLEGE